MQGGLEFNILGFRDSGFRIQGLCPRFWLELVRGRYELDTGFDVVLYWGFLKSRGRVQAVFSYYLPLPIRPPPGL